MPVGSPGLVNVTTSAYVPGDIPATVTEYTVAAKLGTGSGRFVAVPRTILDRKSVV